MYTFDGKTGEKTGEYPVEHGGSLYQCRYRPHASHPHRSTYGQSSAVVAMPIVR